MRTLSDQEKRTIRIGVGALAVYLVLFYGWRGWNALETRRTRYEGLVRQAQQLKRELQPYQKKTVVIQDLSEKFQLDPTKLSKTTLVAEASAAIQKAASTGGVQLGPLRESARGSVKEMASMQLEGVGPVPAIMQFLHRLERLGYPIVFDSVQVTADPSKPGAVKVNLTIVILDYDQWKAPEARHA
jgi:hypothetical protein